VDRVVPVAPQAFLRTFAVEIQTEGKSLSPAHQGGGGNDRLRRDEIERSDFIIGAPTPPVAALLRNLAQVLHVEHRFIVSPWHDRNSSLENRVSRE